MKKLLLMSLLLPALSCKDLSSNDEMQDQGHVYFETEYIIYGPVYAYNGTVIDHEGNVFAYDPDLYPVLYHEDGYYSEDELVTKYAHNRTFIRTMSGDSIRWMRALAISVPMDDYSDTVWAAEAQWTLSYSIFKWNPLVSRYQKVILRLEGSRFFYNKSENAVALVDCMKGG
jgi:hypothetical protein